MIKFLFFYFFHHVLTSFKFFLNIEFSITHKIQSEISNETGTRGILNTHKHVMNPVMINHLTLDLKQIQIWITT